MNSSAQSKPCADMGTHIPCSPQLFYVMSLKWTAGEHITWWGPNNCGYTVDLARAGQYTAEQIESARDYYDSGDSRDGTLAIPVQSAARFVRPVQYVPHLRSVVRKLRAARNRARQRAARDMGSRVAAPVEPQSREEISPSTQGRGVNKP